MNITYVLCHSLFASYYVYTIENVIDRWIIHKSQRYVKWKNISEIKANIHPVFLTIIDKLFKSADKISSLENPCHIIF